MLTRLAIKNFKSIGDPGVNLELRPLTFLVGANGSGKSSVLEALALLVQSINWTSERNASFNLSGYLRQFSSLPEIIHKKEYGRWLSIRINSSKALGGYQCAARVSEETKNAEIRQWTYHSPSDSEAVGITWQLEGRGFQARYSEPQQLADSGLQPSEPHRILSQRAFTPSSSTTRLDNAVRDVIEEQLRFSDQVVEFYSGFLRNHVFFIRAGRALGIGPTQTSQDVPSWVGPYGEDLIAVLNWLNSGEHKSARLAVRNWASKFGISDLSPYAIGTSLDANYDDASLQANVPLRSASYGSAQVLPLITQLCLSTPEEIVMIEEPEISLHPEGQVDMAELLATSAAESKQILVTTHSTFLLLGLTSAVQKNIIKAEDVLVYELEKGRDGTKVKKRLELNKKGALKGWVDSFSAIEKKLMRDWTTTLPGA